MYTTLARALVNSKEKLFCVMKESTHLDKESDVLKIPYYCKPPELHLKVQV